MKKFIIAAAAPLLLAGFSAHAQDAATGTSAAVAAPGARIAGMLDAAPADKGQVVFYRPGGGGGMVGCMVREGEGAAEKHLSKLTGNRYFTVNAEPGTHQYWVKSEATDRLNMEIEPGETYFVKCKISMGFFVGRPNLAPSDLAEFTKYQKKLKLMKKEDQAEDAEPAKAK